MDRQRVSSRWVIALGRALWGGIDEVLLAALTHATVCGRSLDLGNVWEGWDNIK